MLRYDSAQKAGGEQGLYLMKEAVATIHFVEEYLCQTSVADYDKQSDGYDERSELTYEVCVFKVKNINV